MKKLLITIAAIAAITINTFAEYNRTDELSYHGFVLIEVVAVAKDCWRKYGKPAGKNLAMNLKGVMENCKSDFDLSYHPQAKTLPGEELNCFYLDVLEQLRFFGLSRDVYCKEEERIHEEWFHGPHTGRAEETATAIAG